MIAGYCLEVEKRRKLGLPAQVLERLGLAEGDYVSLTFRRDGRVALERVVRTVDDLAGAVPGLTAHTDARPEEVSAHGSGGA